MNMGLVQSSSSSTMASAPRIAAIASSRLAPDSFTRSRMESMSLNASLLPTSARSGLLLVTGSARRV